MAVMGGSSCWLATAVLKSNWRHTLASNNRIVWLATAPERSVVFSFRPTDDRSWSTGAALDWERGLVGGGASKATDFGRISDHDRRQVHTHTHTHTHTQELTKARSIKRSTLMCNWHGQRRHARGPRWPTKRQGHASTKSSARHDTPLISIKPPLALKKRGSETFFSSGLFFIQCQSKISNVVQLKIQAVWFSSFLVQIIHGLFKC